MHKIEESLVEGLKKGSYKDFERLYILYSDALYGFAFSLLKSSSASNDIVQDTFLKVWLNREKITTPSAFKSYLFSIAKNMVYDSFKSNLRNVDFKIFIESDAFQQHITENSREQLDFDDFKEILNQVKSFLTSRQREIFELSKEEGLSHTEIAEHLNISEKTVRNQLTLALSLVRRKIMDYYELFLLFILWL